MAGSDTVQSVERALDLLQALAAADGGLRLSELATQLELNTTTAHNLARTLIGRGFVVKSQGQRLRLGPAIAELLAQEQERTVLHLASAAAVGLQRRFPEATINVAELAGEDLLVRVRVSRDRPGVVQRPRRHLATPYGTAVGLCVLAFADHGSVANLREAHPFHEEGIRLWNSPETLAAHLDAARSAGHVLTPFAGQELWRIAAPVIGSDGQFLAALGLALPVSRATDAQCRDAVAAVTEAAAAIAQGNP